ncbi:hypothetical protein PsYK624_094250 [Phanerochaete sordida]|uniref:Uncharacterized protein n=1 Tax=Phanerochaete sordida TaxID=48140 RepID=A0A9P3LF73_9APHY|nr:hypothetical protein PsYK624_094250 [Phanerochaete sordida]
MTSSAKCAPTCATLITAGPYRPASCVPAWYRRFVLWGDQCRTLRPMTVVRSNAIAAVRYFRAPKLCYVTLQPDEPGTRVPSAAPYNEPISLPRSSGYGNASRTTAVRCAATNKSRSRCSCRATYG